MANDYIVGQVIRLKDLITDPNNADAPIDDATDVVTVYQPDGTTSVPSPAHGVTGTYTATFTPTQTGMHQYVWKSTGAAAGAGRKYFYVAAVP